MKNEFEWVLMEKIGRGINALAWCEESRKMAAEEKNYTVRLSYDRKVVEYGEKAEQARAEFVAAIDAILSYAYPEKTELDNIDADELWCWAMNLAATRGFMNAKAKEILHDAMCDALRAQEA